MTLSIVGGDRGWKTFLQNAQLIEITNVMESNQGVRLMPFQGVNKQYLQLLTRRWGPSEYAKIRVRRVNRGWRFSTARLEIWRRKIRSHV
jgi:hypothetical protein